MQWWHIYLFTRLDNIKWLVSTIIFILALTTIICCLGIIISFLERAGYDNFKESHNYKKWDSYFKTWKKGSIPSAVALMFFMCVSAAIPTQKEVAAIFLIPKIANSEAVSELQNVPKDASKLLRLKLEEYLGDLEPTTKKENSNGKNSR